MGRILIILDKIARPHATGIDMYYRMMLKWLPQVAPDLVFKVVSFGDQHHEFPSERLNISHQVLPYSRRQMILMSRIPFMPNPLNAALKEADVVHLMMPLPINIQHPRVVATIYDLTPIFLPDLYSWHTRIFFRYTLQQLHAMKADFLTISHQTSQDLKNYFRSNSVNTHPIPIGVDEALRPAESFEQISSIRVKYMLPSRYFVYIGSMHKRKNLETLLKAFVRFKQTDVFDIRLVIAGRMELGGTELLQYIQENSLEKNVVLLGYILEEDLPTIISSAEALLYPSLYEGFGLPVLEAMMCGTHVIASTGGSIPEVVGDYGHLCPPFDEECFSEKMHTVIHQPPTAAQRAKARGWALQFSWEATATKTAELYRKLL